MERILVSINAHRGGWEAWSRVISLAKRIDAKVYALLVLPSAMPVAASSTGKETSSVRRRLELQIELAKVEGIPIEYFISEGDYEEEVIRFIEHNKITLLVAESNEGENRQSERGVLGIRRILHRITCKVELVSPKKSQTLSLQKDNGNGSSTASVSADSRK
jgi:nucleotide-binding universal stress UspA family protein